MKFFHFPRQLILNHDYHSEVVGLLYLYHYIHYQFKSRHNLTLPIRNSSILIRQIGGNEKNRRYTFNDHLGSYHSLNFYLIVLWAAILV